MASRSASGIDGHVSTAIGTALLHNDGSSGGRGRHRDTGTHHRLSAGAGLKTHRRALNDSRPTASAVDTIPNGDQEARQSPPGRNLSTDDALPTEEEQPPPARNPTADAVLDAVPGWRAPAGTRHRAA